MKTCLWTAALLVAAFVSVLTGSSAARAADKDKPVDSAARKQMVWDMQIKYATYGAGAVVIAVVAFWMLSKANQGKKKYSETLRKKESLDSSEEMPLT